jgi:hypothetical protein
VFKVVLRTTMDYCLKCSRLFYSHNAFKAGGTLLINCTLARNY